MNKIFLTPLLAALLLSGCATPPPPPPPVEQPTVLRRLQRKADQTVDAGGMASIGVGESKSLETALNRAKSNGRRALALQLGAKIEMLQSRAYDELDLISSGLVSSQLREIEEKLADNHILHCKPTELKYETVDGTVVAYALMVLPAKELDATLGQNPSIVELLYLEDDAMDENMTP